MVTVEIRPATQGDEPSLEIVRRQAIEAGFSGTYDRQEFASLVATPAADLAEWIQSDRHSVLVVETDVTPAAYGTLDAVESRVLGLYTAPAYQREGWGTRLLERFVDTARTRGHSELSATVPLGAADFFAANDFERRARTEAGGLECIEMVRSL